MAKAVGLIGSLKGKVGNTVFATRRGTQVARVYQPVVAQPKSARQQLSRAKFALATESLRPFSLFLRAGWQKSNPTYEMQQGIKRMVPVSEGVITGNTPAMLAVEWDQLYKVFSADGLQEPSTTGVQSVNDGELTTPITIPAANFLDEHGDTIDCGMVIAVKCDGLDRVLLFHEKGFSGDVAKTLTLTVPVEWSGTRVYVYGFAKQIPSAVNGIPSTDLPWMYPAKTSACIYIGTCDVA